MTTDKEAAAAYRLLADYRDKKIWECGVDKSQTADRYRKIADELDPPKPTWPNYTVAYVTTQGGGKALARYDAVDREWECSWSKYNAADAIIFEDDVVKVEPLRVLGDDEIAVKRANGGEPHSSVVRLLRDQNFEVSAEWMANIVDTYAAEAGDAK